MQEKRLWAISIVCGLLCAACIVWYTVSVQGQVDQARQEALEKYGGDQLEVCVATRDIVAGETISASDVETKLWVAALLPDQAQQDKSQVVGSMASSTILSGEVITARRLGSTSDSLEVPDGLTAVSVPAKSVQAVGGAITPGLSVDLYSTGDTTTTRLGESLLVLATSASADSKATEVSWITLAVKPESVQELVAAAQTSTLYFTLPGESVSAAQDAASGQSSTSSDKRENANSASSGGSQAAAGATANANANSNSSSNSNANANAASNTENTSKNKE